MRLSLSVIAYNLGNLWRRLVPPNRIGNWSLTSLHQRLTRLPVWKHGAGRYAALADRIARGGGKQTSRWKEGGRRGE